MDSVQWVFLSWARCKNVSLHPRLSGALLNNPRYDLPEESLEFPVRYYMEGNVSKIEFRADRCKHNISYPVSNTSDTGSQVSSSPSGIEYDRQTWSRKGAEMNLPVFLAVHLRRNIPSFLFTINTCNIVTYLLKSYTQKLSELSFEPLAPMTSINLFVLKAVQCALWRRRENKRGSCESLRKEKLKLKWYRYRHYGSQAIMNTMLPEVMHVGGACG